MQHVKEFESRRWISRIVNKPWTLYPAILLDLFFFLCFHYHICNIVIHFPDNTSFFSVAAGIGLWTFVFFSATAGIELCSLSSSPLLLELCCEVLSSFSAGAGIELCRLSFSSTTTGFEFSSFFLFFSTSAGTEIHRQSSSPLLLLEWNCVDSSLCLCSLLELICVIHGCIWIPSLSSKCLFSKPVH